MSFFPPFDFSGVEYLEKIGVTRYKIASLEITDIPLIHKVAQTGKPIIISTGVATESDIDLAVKTCLDVGNENITLLKCTSQYPASIADANLQTIPDMKKRFGIEVGVSDHTMGSLVPIVAVSLGARVVEKHFILDRSIGGADSSFSMQPDEFADMVLAVRAAELALGQVCYDVTDTDRNRRRSLFAVENIKAGELFTNDNVKSVRPGYGLRPNMLTGVLGKSAAVDIDKGTPLSTSLISAV